MNDNNKLMMKYITEHNKLMFNPIFLAPAVLESLKKCY